MRKVAKDWAGRGMVVGEGGGVRGQFGPGDVGWLVAFRRRYMDCAMVVWSWKPGAVAKRNRAGEWRRSE